MNKVEQVEAWLTNCLPEVKLSKSEIESLLLRGPFKDILLQFLVPRCRSAEEVDVIRSNLYVHGLRSSEPAYSSSNNSKAFRKNQELTSVLADLEGRKILEMENLAKTAAAINRGDSSGGTSRKRMLEEDVFAKRKELQELHDIIAFTEGLTTNLTPILETENLVVLEQEVKSGESLEKLQEEAITLFRSTFFETASPHMLQELNQKLEDLCDIILRGGNNNGGSGQKLTHKQLVVWQKGQILKARSVVHKLQGMAQANYVEEIHNEMQKLELDLSKQHIQLNQVNEGLKSQAESATKARQAQLLGWTNDGISNGVNRTYLLKLLLEEQLKAELKTCQEIRESATNNKDSTIKNNYSLVSEASSMNSFKNSENVENLVSGLLKTYSDTKSKLVAIPQTGRYAEFIAALKPDRQIKDIEQYSTTTNTAGGGGEQDDDMFHAINPNKEVVSPSFSLQYSSNNNNNNGSR